MTVNERYKIIEDTTHIYCVSEYIRKRFLDGLKGDFKKIYVLYNGVDRVITNFPIKKKEVIFVGRLVPEKGVHLFVEAVNSIATKFVDWKFFIIGSSHLGSNPKKSSFTQTISEKFLKIGSQCEFTGYINPNDVQKKMQSASIIVIPSIWEEPFGLVVVEAMANGIAVIASKVGGIPEILDKNQFLINNINSTKIKNILLQLMFDKELLIEHQKLSWDKFNCSSQRSSKNLDSFRSKIIKSFG